MRGLTGRRILDNLLGMIDRGDERYKVMVGAYAVGLAISVALIVLRL
ncbi:MAG: hypothetical protein KKI08_03085 [Armatimonadetes bacterium]|nr:hypothetical protein [Armatimonadota bacterium]